MEKNTFNSIETAFILGELIGNSAFITVIMGVNEDSYCAIEGYIKNNGSMHFRQNLLPSLVDGFIQAATQWEEKNGFLPKSWDLEVLPTALVQLNKEFNKGVSTESCYRIMFETLTRLTNN